MVGREEGRQEGGSQSRSQSEAGRKGKEKSCGRRISEKVGRKEGRSETDLTGGLFEENNPSRGRTNFNPESEGGSEGRREAT